jgi:hypothetical protein
MDTMTELVNDNEAMRTLIQHWRATPEATAKLLPTTAHALRAMALAKEQVLYREIRAHDPARGKYVDEAVRHNDSVDAFLAEAEQITPDGFGFLDQAHAAASEADLLLLTERRDLFPALDAGHVDEEEAEQILSRYRAARRAASRMPDETLTKHAMRH